MALHHLFVSCYTTSESEIGTARGIYICALDADTGSLSAVGSEDDSFNPTYLALTRDGRFLYAADEVEGCAMIAAYAIEPETRLLTFINRETFPGGGLCNIHVGPDRRHLFAANYLGGNVLAVRANGDGGVGELIANIQGEGSSVDPHRQTKPYAHCAMPDPDARFLLCCDLGTDRVTTCAIGPDGGLSPSSEIALAPGEGPRHLIFDRAAQRAFIATELMNHVISCTYDKATGALTPAMTLPMLPDGAEGKFNGADLHLSPDERILYASVRDITSHGADGIAVYRVDGTTLAPDGFIPTKKLPRGFAVSPDGRWLVVACQGSDAVQVIDAASREVASELRLPLPVCVKFAVQRNENESLSRI